MTLLKQQIFREAVFVCIIRKALVLISFWLNPGYLNNVRQNEKMYTLISDSSEATLWRSADSTGNYSFEIGLHGIYPNLVRLDILIRGVNQTKIQTLKYSKINMLSRSEYDNIKQTFMMRINKFDLEN